MSSGAEEAAPEPERPPVREALVLDDAPETLSLVRSQAEADRIEALARFSAAQLQRKRGELAPALRNYQRAFRYDPTSRAIAGALIPLAAGMGREDEAGRYAMLAPEDSGVDAALLRKLATRLASQGHIDGAIAVLVKARAACNEKTSVALRTLIQIDHGRLCAEAGRMEDAAESLRHVADVWADPGRFDLNLALLTLLLGEPRSLHRTMGEVFLAVDDPQRAEAAFELAYGGGVDGPIGYHRSRLFSKRGDPTAALEQLETYLKAGYDGQDVAPLRLWQELLESLGHDDYRARLEELARNRPELKTPRLALAETYLGVGDHARAEAILAGNDDGSKEWIDLAARVHLAQGDTEGLLNRLAEWVARDPSSWLPHDVSARVAADAQARDRILEQAEALSVENASLAHLVAAAQVLFVAEQWEPSHRLVLEVARRLQAADGSNVDGPSFVPATLVAEWGLRFLAAERPAEAVALLEQALTMRSEPSVPAPLIRYHLAAALALSGRTDEAARMIRQALSVRALAMFRLRLAWLHLRMGNEEEAFREYQAIIDRDDSVYDSASTRESVATARTVLSSLHLQRGDTARAVELLEQVLDEFPDDHSALNDLGYLWADANVNLPRALAMIQRAVAARPDKGAYRDSLGWVYHRLGRHEEALVELNEAARLLPDPVVYEHLGDVYARVGRHAEARQAYREAIEVAEKDGSSFLAETRADLLARLHEKFAALAGPD